MKDELTTIFVDTVTDFNNHIQKLVLPQLILNMKRVK